MPSEKAVIAVRLDDALHEAVRQLSKDEHRSLANTVEILVRMGLREFNERNAAAGQMEYPKHHLMPTCKLCGSKHYGPERGPQCAFPAEPLRD